MLPEGLYDRTNLFDLPLQPHLIMLSAMEGHTDIKDSSSPHINDHRMCNCAITVLALHSAKGASV